MATRWTYFVLAGSLALASCSSKPTAKSSGDGYDVLRQNRDAMYALRSYQATCRTKLTYDNRPDRIVYEYASLTAEKPNKMRYDSWREMGGTGFSDSKPVDTPAITFACDGVQSLKQFGEFYRKDTRTSPEDMGTILEPWKGFYSGQGSILGGIQDLVSHAGSAEVKLGGQETINGVLCDKVLYDTRVKYDNQIIHEEGTFYIGKDDHLVRRLTAQLTFGDKRGFTREATISDIKLNQSVDSKVYAYRPPRGVTLEAERVPPSLLTKGTPAPDFSAVTLENKKIRLSDFKGKVVVLDFWASWCGPCKASMPHTQAVAKELSSQGVPVVVLAADDGEPKGAFDEWVSSNRAQYPDLIFASCDPKDQVSGRAYKVSGIPTQYVIDKTGKVQASFVGYGGETDDLKNAIVRANG